MDTLAKLKPADDADFPLLAAGLRPAVAANSLWAWLGSGVDERTLLGRDALSLAVFRELILTLTEIARQDSVTIAMGKILDRSGFLHELGEDRTEDAEARIETLAELVSAAREYESR